MNQIWCFKDYTRQASHGERNQHSTVQYSRVLFRLGPELLTFLTALWSKRWQPLTGIAGLNPQLPYSNFLVYVQTCIYIRTCAPYCTCIFSYFPPPSIHFATAVRLSLPSLLYTYSITATYHQNNMITPRHRFWGLKLSVQVRPWTFAFLDSLAVKALAPCHRGRRFKSPPIHSCTY